MCAWSRPIAENLMWCVGGISGAEVLAGSIVAAPETPCASAVEDTPDSIPASPAACRKSRRFVALISIPPSLEGANIPQQRLAREEDRGNEECPHFLLPRFHPFCLRRQTVTPANSTV